MNTRVQPAVKLPVKCQISYHSHLEYAQGDYDTASFRQNLEAKCGDRWLVELNLDRWRCAKELAAYLRWAAESIEALAAKKPNDKLRRGAKTAAKL